MREHERGHRRVADGARVGTAVGQAEETLRVQHHLADVVEVAEGVVEDRDVEQSLPTVVGHLVVGHFQWRPTARRRHARQ